MADRGYPAGSGPHRLKERQQTAPAARSEAPSDDSEKTIVVRDRRKPNQYTTDNVIAREWLPILRVGDAFFFYSVYLSMANRETESSWGSLRTQAEYLQCSVDLIVRGNKLLEICELVHIETGNQYTSNEYYILDPPPLTPELCSRIRQRLKDIARQETSKNWQSWVKQVRKALDRHRSLPDIWADRRARRGGRPVKALRPDEAAEQEKGACDSQAGFQASVGGGGNGDRGSQAPWLWDTYGHGVSHNQGERDSRPEQEVLTSTSQQDKESKEISPALVRSWLAQLGIAEATIAALEERYPIKRIMQQLEWLRYRNPRDPAAMLVSAIQGNWDSPAQASARECSGDPDSGQDAADRTLFDWPGQETPVSFLSPGRAASGDANAEQDGFFLEGTSVDMRSAWAQLLSEMRMQMTRVTFDTWLGGSEVVGVQGNVVTVLVRDGYAVDWLEARWKQPIERTLSGIAGCPVDVRFVGPDASRGSR
jgi:hypothetical protein